MKDHEGDDPMELVGFAYPGDELEADTDLTRVLVEEFALAGFSGLEVARLFESPVYAASHAVLRRQGTDFVRQIIGDVFGVRS